MQLKNDDLTLNLEIDGDDNAPPVLLLHGITQSAATWRWLVPELSDRFRVLRLDFRGHGSSDRSPGNYAASDFISDAVTVCREVAGQPCALVGHSLGGGTAIGVAQTHPELVRGFVMEDAPLFKPDEFIENALTDGFALLRESVPQFQAMGMSAVDLAGALAGAPTSSGSTFGAELTDEGLAAMAEALLELDASVLDKVVDKTLGPFYDSSAPVIVPGLAIAADPAMPDSVTRPLDLERLEQHSPSVQTRTIAGAGHLIHDSRAHRDTLRDAVVGFLDSLD